ncbi:hypothetical protein ACPWT1_20945 [Ramlibacter sp. MMS24-I3-19]|uniref:hypothetical protein n=1 Tax=Ramlibacter sp. MMS24-I3-19 TaxID=3416606 RepID=UPI003D067C6F
MPNAKGNLKLTGDTHLPDAESDLDVEEGTSTLASLAQVRDQPGRPQVRRAGVLLAPEGDAGLDATAGARDASTSRRTLPRSGAGRTAPGEGDDRGRAGMQPQVRSAWGVWLGALAAAVVLARLMR